MKVCRAAQSEPEQRNQIKEAQDLLRRSTELGPSAVASFKESLRVRERALETTVLLQSEGKIAYQKKTGKRFNEGLCQSAGASPPAAGAGEGAATSGSPADLQHEACTLVGARSSFQRTFAAMSKPDAMAGIPENIRAQMAAANRQRLDQINRELAAKTAAFEKATHRPPDLRGCDKP
jgi:hypothetical protein